LINISSPTSKLEDPTDRAARTNPPYTPQHHRSYPHQHLGTYSSV